MLHKDFTEELAKGKEDPYKDDFLTLMKDINYICEDKKIDVEVARRAKIFAVYVYSFAKDTVGTICVDYESKIPRLSVAINYPKLKCVGFEYDDLKYFAKLLEVSTKVMICPPEAYDDGVVLIFEHDML